MQKQYMQFRSRLASECDQRGGLEADKADSSSRYDEVQAKAALCEHELCTKMHVKQGRRAKYVIPLHNDKAKILTNFQGEILVENGGRWFGRI